MPCMLWKYDDCLFQLPYDSIRAPGQCKNGSPRGKPIGSKLESTKVALKLFCQQLASLCPRTYLYASISAFRKSEQTRYDGGANPRRSKDLVIFVAPGVIIPGAGARTSPSTHTKKKLDNN